METEKFKDLFLFGPKSKVKAGDGLKKGRFPFYTSSPTLSKWINKEQYFDEALIFGTGGSASIHYADEPFATSTDCLVAIARTNKSFNVKYVYYYIYTNIRILEQGFKGAGLEHISKPYIQNLDIPLPDLESQDKIVAILDKAQNLIEKRGQTIQKFDDLLRATFVDMFGDPVENPKGWQIVDLQELGSWRTGGTPSRANRNNFIGSIPWITSGELNNIYISETKEQISEDALKMSNAKLIEKYSLLIGMYDTAALKSSINLIEATCNQAIAYAKINNEKANVIFLYYMIQIGKEHYKSTQRGVRQQNMNLSMIKKIKSISPPIDLQIQFSKIVNKVNSIRAKIIESKYEIENLLKGLSQSAFNGELKFNTAVDLEILMENDYNFFKKHADKKAIQLLLERMDKNILNKKKFYEEELYDKAKIFVFNLLEDKKIEQVYEQEKIKLVVK